MKHRNPNQNPPRLPKGATKPVNLVRAVKLEEVRVPGSKKKETPSTPPSAPNQPTS